MILKVFVVLNLKSFVKKKLNNLICWMKNFLVWFYLLNLRLKEGKDLRWIDKVLNSEFKRLELANIWGSNFKNSILLRMKILIRTADFYSDCPFKEFQTICSLFLSWNIHSK